MSTRATAGAAVPVLPSRPETLLSRKLPTLLLARPLRPLPSPRRRRSTRRACRRPATCFPSVYPTFVQARRRARRDVDADPLLSRVRPKSAVLPPCRGGSAPRWERGRRSVGCLLPAASLSATPAMPPPDLPLSSPPFAAARGHRSARGPPFTLNGARRALCAWRGSVHGPGLEAGCCWDVYHLGGLPATPAASPTLYAPHHAPRLSLHVSHSPSPLLMFSSSQTC